MFATHEVMVPARFEVTAARLADFRSRGALPDASEAAYTRGLVAGLDAASFGMLQGLPKLARVRSAEPVQRHGVITMPLRWEITGAPGELFPVLDADLTLTRASEIQTRIRLDGSYRAPFASAAAELGRDAMSRLAVATIGFLLECVADAVTEPVPPGRRVLSFN